MYDAPSNRTNRVRKPLLNMMRPLPFLFVRLKTTSMVFYSGAAVAPAAETPSTTSARPSALQLPLVVSVRS